MLKETKNIKSTANARGKEYGVVPSIRAVSLLHHQGHKGNLSIHAILSFESAIGRVLVLLAHTDQHHVRSLNS